jgi:O-antigen/teichoic acid export membrane protein
VSKSDGTHVKRRPVPAAPSLGVRRRLAKVLDRDVVQLVRGSGLIFACRVVGAVLALLTQWVLARWMGAEDLGSYLLAYSWMILVARLAGLGYNSASVRFIGEGIALDDRSTIRGFVTFTTRTVYGVSIAVAVLGGVGAYLLLGRSGGDPWPMVIAFATVPIVAGCGNLFGFALSYSWFRAAFIPNTVLRPALFLGSVSLIWWMGPSIGVSGVMLLQLGSMAAALVTLAWVAGRPLRRHLAGVSPRFERGLWTQTSLALLIISLFRDYLPELSIIVAGVYLAPEEIAIFTIGYRIATLISFVLFAVDSFTLPRIAQAAALQDRAALQSYSQRATLLTFLASLGALLGFWLFGRFVLGLFGEEFVEGYALLLIIAVAQVLRSSVGPVLPLLTVGGHERESLKVYGASLVIVAPVVMVLAPAWGVEGVGIAVASVIVLSSLALNHRVRHLMGIKPSILSALSMSMGPKLRG